MISYFVVVVVAVVITVTAIIIIIIKNHSDAFVNILQEHLTQSESKCVTDVMCC